MPKTKPKTKKAKPSEPINGNGSDAEVPQKSPDCPCERWLDSDATCCDICNTWWHNNCGNLCGLSDKDTKKLITWSCPRCFHSSLAVKAVDTPVNTANCSTLRVILKEELNLIVPVITNTVKSDVTTIVGTEAEKTPNLEAVLPDIVQKVINESEKKTESKWADLLKKTEEIKSETKTTISNEIADANSKLVETAMVNSKKAIDSNFMERERRRKNVVIVNAPESGKSTLAEQKEDDRDTVIELLQVDSEEIKGIYRAGPQLGEGRNKDRTKPRPIIVSLSTPQLAEQLHAHGYGKRVFYEIDNAELEGKTEIPVYINKDLILADRVANYEARVARNKRRETDSQSFRNQTESGIQVT